jgi:uncharacterized protein (DUF488 family)
MLDSGQGPRRVLTIGHSTRTLEAFLILLRAHAVSVIADVRTIPRSRRNPQFNLETLPTALRDNGIGYRHLAALGGFRRPTRDSVNQGWRNDAFRGFADYMQTAEFEAALEALVQLASRDLVALMCAEAVPWRCHRSLIADALTLRGVRVEHILGEDQTQAHRLTPWAEVRGARIVYPEPGVRID